MVAYANVIDDEVVTSVSDVDQLPTIWTWPDGAKTSNFQVSDEETLNAAGWYPISDSEVEYDPETHRLVNERIVVENGLPVRTWDVEEIGPEPGPSPALPPSDIQRLQAKNDALQDLADSMLTDMLMVFDILINNGLI